MIRWLAARVRRAHHNGEHCALWVEINYMEPFGWYCWAVRIHPFGNADEYEAGRSRWLRLALWRAWKDGRRRAKAN